MIASKRKRPPSRQQVTLRCACGAVEENRDALATLCRECARKEHIRRVKLARDKRRSEKEPERFFLGNVKPVHLLPEYRREANLELLRRSTREERMIDGRPVMVTVVPPFSSLGSI